jgi:uncharacterized membrane protein YphA (DoxX/SURF4 family)
MKSKLILILRLIAAIIFLQTLYFKFTGAPESKFIFTTLGVEPWGRWISGICELFASAFLLIPRTQIIGALMGVGIMLSAIISHIFILGIVIQNDGGLLFCLAWIVLICCISILFFNRTHIFKIMYKIKDNFLKIIF